MSPKKKINKKIDDTQEEDIIFEESDIPQEKIKKIKDKLNKCLSENKQNLLGWQRARADFVNAKKENEERIRDSSSYAKASLIEEMLPVADSFEMAFADKKAWEKVDKNWRVGVEYIYSQLISVFESNGVKQINPLGSKFDHNLHTSIETIKTNNKKEDGVVIEVVQKGYELGGRVIRAAKVKVAQYEKDK